MSATIRLATPEDAEQVWSIYAPLVERTAASLEIAPPSVDEMRQRIVTTLEVKPFLVCDQKGEVLGFVYAREHRTRAAYQWSVNLSVYVHSQVRRAGVGRGMYTSLFQMLALQGYYRAHAGITLPNPASVGLHESMGFRLVGIFPSVGFKLGAWHDVSYWQLALQEPAIPAGRPLGMEAASKLPGWAEALASGQRLLRL